MARKLSLTEQRLQEIQTKLTKWNDFVGELQVPAEIAPAIATGRCELVKLAQPRELTAEECGVLYRLIGGLLETNQALQAHASLLSQMAGDVRYGVQGLMGMAERLNAYGHFQTPEDSDDE